MSVLTDEPNSLEPRLQGGRIFCKGAVIKYGTEGGGRDLTGSPKILDGKCWANKLLQVINMGHEAICFWICFQYLQKFQTLPALFLLFF